MIDLEKPNMTPPILFILPKIDASPERDILGLRNVISNEKTVSEITKDNTKETSIVKGQFPKKNSSNKGIS
tara:strand:+ start:1402 stop:1614 length:213 start_codon:yes stop_codon:yes gene_type:complete